MAPFQMVVSSFSMENKKDFLESKWTQNQRLIFFILFLNETTIVIFRQKNLRFWIGLSTECERMTDPKSWPHSYGTETTMEVRLKTLRF